MEVNNNRSWKLPEELAVLSEEKSWPKMLKEWAVDYIEDLEVGEESETCLCHHHPIREVCHIVNKGNNKTAIVGNCCVKKFEGETAFSGTHKLFASMKRVRTNENNSANEELLDYAFERKILSKKEYGFYLNIWRKRKLTDSQEDWKVRLNKKILRGASSSKDEQNKIEVVQEVAEKTLADMQMDLRADPASIASKELVKRAFEVKVISEKDYDFYNTFLVENRSWSPSEKQQKWIDSVNRKMLATSAFLE